MKIIEFEAGDGCLVYSVEQDLEKAYQKVNKYLSEKYINSEGVERGLWKECLIVGIRIVADSEWGGEGAFVMDETVSKEKFERVVEEMEERISNFTETLRGVYKTLNSINESGIIDCTEHLIECERSLRLTNKDIENIIDKKGGGMR